MIKAGSDTNNLLANPLIKGSNESLRSISSHLPYDYCLKLLMLGDSNVGKSSLLIRFAEKKFNPYLMGTSGIDFKTNFIDVDEKKIKLELWDTAGHERFRAITSKYYQGAMGIVLVYDVSERKSFENVNYWIEQIKRETGEDSDIIILLIGNKIDLDRCVSKEEGEILAKKYRIPFVETSAKDDKYVNDSFILITKMILQNENILNKIKNKEEDGLKPAIYFANNGFNKKNKCC